MAVAIDYVDRVLCEQCDKRVPGDLHGARRHRDGGEQHADESCILDVGRRVVGVQPPPSIEKLQHDVGGDGERLRLRAPQEGAAEALSEQLEHWVLFDGVRVVVELRPGDDGREGDVDGAARVGADEQLDPEGERAGVHWQGRDAGSLAELAPLGRPCLVLVAGGDGQGALHHVAAVQRVGGCVMEMDGLVLVGRRGTEESDTSAVHVEHSEALVEEEVLELLRGEHRGVGGRRCTRSRGGGVAGGVCVGCVHGPAVVCCLRQVGGGVGGGFSGRAAGVGRWSKS